MQPLRATASLIAATFLLGLGSAWAQPANAPDKRELIELVAPAPTQSRVLVLKNVRPSLMAYWLDPAHNPKPALFTQSPLDIAGANNSTAKESPLLPGTIEQLVSVDPQNVLLIAGGSDEDIRQLRALVNLLDQPQRQVEIASQFIELSAEGLSALGIEANANQPQIYLMRGNFQARLDALVAEGQARFFTKLFAESRSPFVNWSSGTLSIADPATKRSYDLTPTLQNDGTITLTLTSKTSVETAPQDSKSAVSVTNFTTLINVRNGDTIALTGLPIRLAESTAPNLADIPNIGQLFPSSKTAKKNTLVFLYLSSVRVNKADTEKTN